MLFVSASSDEDKNQIDSTAREWAVNVHRIISIVDGLARELMDSVGIETSVDYGDPVSVQRFLWTITEETARLKQLTDLAGIR